ncbi:MAG: lysylphosphatidylglycerol synthase transmembrane domain-containing protein [Lentisphaerota bacterium]
MKKKWSLAARIIISLALLWLVYRHINVAQLASHFTQGSLWLLPLIYLLLFANTVLNSLRWELFVKADGSDASLRRLVPSLLISGFLNTFLPSTIGGDFYRVYDLSQGFTKTPNALASVIASRLTGYMALTVWGIIFALWGITHLPHHLFVFLPLGAFLLMGTALWMFFQQKLLKSTLHLLCLDRIGKITLFVDRFLQVFTIYRKYPGAFAKALMLGLLFQGVVILCVYLMAAALGIQTSFFYFCVFVPMISLIEMLPVTIFGLGLRDGAYVFFFNEVGMLKEDALSIALLYVIITISYSMIGGILLFLRMGQAKRRTTHADT